VNEGTQTGHAHGMGMQGGMGMMGGGMMMPPSAARSEYCA
jgi:hypothetical protein